MTAAERRNEDRGRFRVLWDLVFRGLRMSYGHVHSFTTALGLFLVAGGLVAIAFTYAFARIAELVRSGYTQPFDESVLRWMERHPTPLAERPMVEVTMLGTWIVVLSIVSIAALFLWLTRHNTRRRCCSWRLPAVLASTTFSRSASRVRVLRSSMGHDRKQLVLSPRAMR